MTIQLSRSASPLLLFESWYARKSQALFDCDEGGSKMTKLLHYSWREKFLIGVLVVLIVLTLASLRGVKLEAVSQMWLTGFALILSYWAITFARDKLRLDLFQRRFEIYLNTLKYCNHIRRYARHWREQSKEAEDLAALQAAYDSFRGIGRHETIALFGEDIKNVFDRLNENFVFIEAHQNDESRSSKEYWGHVVEVVELSEKLPDLFKPYIYFGDVRVI